jgi:peptide/nickel transport system permease protein
VAPGLTARSTSVAAYIARRMLAMVPLLVGVTIAVFGIMQLIPGNPMHVLMNPQVTDPQSVARLEKELGFLDPWPVQYLRWLRQLAAGNLGYSYLTGKSVGVVIGENLPRTLLLGSIAVLVGFVIAVPLGVLSALKRYSLADRAVTLLAFGGISVPEFFICMMLVYWVSLRLGALPPSGFETMFSGLAGLPLWLDRLQHLVLPATAIALPLVAGVVRFTRSAVLDVLSEDYVRTARAKGAPGRTVTFKHTLRNALIPVITLLGLTVPNVLSGAFAVEYIFDWPGIGTLAVRSVANREYSIILGINLLTAVMVMAGNLIADVLYALADPRIRYA